MQAVKSLDAIMPAIKASFAKVKVKPKYKSKTEIHHIVAQTAPLAQAARNIIKNVDIKINDKINLIELKTGLHRRLHTKLYYGAINVLMESSYSTKKKKNDNLKSVKAMYNLIKIWLGKFNAWAPF
ncbi:AHH domain-containing protein [Lysinibacillus sp. RC79]|uniref:AHH domain-containing protein n=1 Tax=Lysinibacillus sp. RC79 TaxID=3156296 RepID=UPI003511408D